MTYEEYLKVSDLNRGVFIQRVNDEVESIKQEIKNIHERKELSIRLNAISNDINSVIDNKDLYIGIDDTLEGKFKLLIFLREKNNLDNALAQEEYLNIINNEKLKSIINYEINEKELEDLNIKLEFLQEFINGNYSDFIHMFNYLHQFKYDDDFIVSVYFNLFVKTNLKKEKKVEVKEENKNEVVINETPSVETTEAITEEIIDLELINEFEKLYKEYKDNNEKYKDVISYCVKLLHKHKNIYDKYSLDEIINDEYISDENKLVFLYERLNGKKEDIESIINGKKNDTYYALIIDSINDYNNILKLLLEKYNKVIESNKKEEQTVFKIFVAHDDNGSFIDLDTYSKKLNAFINKVNNGSIERREVKTTQLNGCEKEVRDLGKTLYLYDSNISYIQLSNGIYVITIDNESNIRNNTRAVIARNYYRIKNQVKLIENNDEKELEIQKKLINEIINIQDNQVKSF